MLSVIEQPHSFNAVNENPKRKPKKQTFPLIDELKVRCPLQLPLKKVKPGKKK